VLTNAPLRPDDEGDTLRILALMFASVTALIATVPDAAMFTVVPATVRHSVAEAPAIEHVSVVAPPSVVTASAASVRNV